MYNSSLQQTNQLKLYSNLKPRKHTSVNSEACKYSKVEIGGNSRNNGLLFNFLFTLSKS